MAGKPKDPAPAPGTTRDIETIKGGTLEADLAAIMSGNVQIEIDSDAIQRRILARKLAAMSLDELLDDGEVTGVRDILGQPFTAINVSLNNSDFEEGPGVYMLIEATLDGKPVTLSTGAQNVMRDLCIMMHRGWLPAKVMVTEAKERTAAGYKPLHLRPVGVEDEPF